MFLGLAKEYRDDFGRRLGESAAAGRSRSFSGGERGEAWSRATMRKVYPKSALIVLPDGGCGSPAEHVGKFV